MRNKSDYIEIKDEDIYDDSNFEVNADGSPSARLITEHMRNAEIMFGKKNIFYQEEDIRRVFRGIDLLKQTPRKEMIAIAKKIIKSHLELVFEEEKENFEKSYLTIIEYVRNKITNSKIANNIIFDIICSLYNYKGGYEVLILIDN